MAREGRTVRETIEVPGIDASVLFRQLQGVAAEDTRYSVVPAGDDRFTLVRTYRPNWALVTAGCTAVLAGLGLLFLLVKRTESLEVAVVAGPTSAVMFLTGRALPETLDGLHMTAQRHVSVAPAAAPVEPALEVSLPRITPMPKTAPAATVRVTEPDVRVAPTTAVPAQPAPPPPPAPPPSVVAPPSPVVTAPLTTVSGFRLDGAAVHPLPTAGPVLIGRAPSGEGQLVAVPAPAPTVSKTHLKLWRDDTGVYVEDLGSTNGTAVRSSDGTTREIPPSIPTPLHAGDQVCFGDVVLDLVTA